MANITAAPQLEQAPVTEVALARHSGGFVVLAQTR